MSPDERPEPQYGEYASDAEWESAIVRSGAEIPQKHVENGPEKNLAQQLHTTPASPTKVSRQTPQSKKSTGWNIDRLATIFLLAFGLMSIIGGAGEYFSFSETLNRLFTQLGIGEYTPTSLTPVFGIIIVVSQAVLWLAATVWSFLRIRLGRIAFWVPIVGAVVTFLVLAVFLGTLLATDPAFVAFAGTT